MKIVVMLLCVLLITLPVLAGTFRDDFEDGNAEGYILTVGRPPADPEQSLIEVQNGVLLVRRPSGRGLHITIGDADKWSDYTIECDMRIIERIPNEWANLHYAGFAGRFRPDNNRLTRDIMWFMINLVASPTVWKGLIIHPDNWLINVQTPFNAKINIWYHLKMVIKGDDYQFFVDGELVDSFKSQAIPTGRVGLCIGGCAAEYDNIVITGSDVPDAGPSGFAVISRDKLANTWGQIRRRI